MNRQQLLSRLGRDVPIVYSTGIPQRGRRRPQGLGWRGGLIPCDNVWIDVSPQWLFRANRSALARRVADCLAVRRWRSLAKASGASEVVAYVFHPKFWPLVERLQPASLVYHAYDLYHLQGKRQNSFDREERAIVGAADVVIASSTAIAERLRDVGASEVDLIENAADYELFSAVDVSAAPADLVGISRPRVGYTGALNRKVDFPLLARLADRLPTVQFVFIGQVGRIDPEGMTALEHLRTRANAHFLGFKTPAELPWYMAAMDVNVMAYRVGGDVWTEGIYPLKLHEYLAVGRPVVSSDIPAVRAFDDVIGIARSTDAWEKCLGDALAGHAAGSVASRRAKAKQNSWDARVDQLRTILSTRINLRPSTSTGPRPGR